jgi:uncharacterized protein YegL
VVILLLACAAASQAQPELNFKRIEVYWPEINLCFTPGCNGRPLMVSDKRHFRLEENGVEVPDFELWCPDPTIDCALSVALVFDASGSMAGSGNAGAKAGGNAFIDLMNGVTDEAAVLWFNTAVTTQQQMTTSTDLLHAAVNALPANGGTAVWDGMYFGILELINNGVNMCRAVIVMTDGQDNSSSRQPAEAISIAQRNRVRVFTIGLGSSINESQLRLVAERTGGRYYAPLHPSELTAIYMDIATEIFHGFHECWITYHAQCMDGAVRDLRLTMRDTCGASVSATRSYIAPKDTSTFAPMRLRLGRREARGNGIVAVPVELLDAPAGPVVFPPVQFSVACNPLYARCVAAQAPSQSPLAGLPLAVASTAGSVVVQSTQFRPVNISAAPCTLFELVYEATASGLPDSVRCPLSFSSFSFYHGGCWRPLLEDGEILLLHGTIALECAAQAPDALAWNGTAQAYAPNPFTAGMTVRNTGSRSAENASLRIIADPSVLQLVDPADTVRPGQPASIPPQGSTHAEFQIRALPRVRGDSARICIEARFANTTPITCCRSVYVPAARAELHCALAVPDIAADTAMQRYAPMPFSVLVTVTNTATVATDTIDADLAIPAPLVLAGADSAGSPRKRLSPPVLAPGQQGIAAWTLAHPLSVGSVNYAINAGASASNCDSSACAGTLRIPGIGNPEPRIAVEPDTLDFGPILVGSWLRLALTLRNYGRANLLLSASITGADAASFRLTSQPPDSIRSQGTGYCPVEFHPDSVGPKRALLRIASNDPTRPTLDVVLLGEGTGRRPEIQASYETLHFGNVALGNSLELDDLVYNIGTAVLHIASQSAGGDFTIVQPLPDSLNVWEWSPLRIRFTPTAVGPATSTALIVSDDPDRPNYGICLTGNGIAPRISFNTRQIHFGTVPVGFQKLWPLTITNVGTATLAIAKQDIAGPDSLEFAIGTPAASYLEPNLFSPVILRFCPQSPTARRATLVVVSNSITDSTAYIMLTGNGTTTAIGDPGVLPSEPQLTPAYPNPFEGGTSLSYALPAAMQARLSVTDALGREVALLADGIADAGSHTVAFDARALPPGAYFVILRSGGRVRTMAVVKAGKP